MGKIAIAIVGPTASGKSFVAHNLAKELNGEIISADSRQFYRKLDIGTAKPSKKDLSEVSYHFVDFLEPDESYNVGSFEVDALKRIEKIFDAKKIPIIAGGSGLYVKGIIDGIGHDVGDDPEFRDSVKAQIEAHGTEIVHKILRERDPKSAEEIPPKNWKRAMRALEILHITGDPVWKLSFEKKRELNFQIIQFGLDWDREKLYERINCRVDEMIKSGLVKEVERILDEGFDPKLNSLNTVGYKEIISYLRGESDLSRAIELIKRNTRRFAKRQLTWFRADERIEWIRENCEEDLANSHFKILSKLKK